MTTQGLLTKEHYQAGISLDFDDHVVTLKRDNRVVARFSAMRVTMKELHHAADQEMEMAKAVEIGNNGEPIINRPEDDWREVR
jgi:hypothetical protein